MKTLNRLGLALLAVYAMATLARLITAWFADGDPEGHFVFLQIPVLSQMAPLHELGLDALLDRLSWPVAYLLFVLPMLLLLYATGVLIRRGWAFVLHTRSIRVH